jgi:NADH-quinone oxidoreductase subunit L
MHGMNDEVDMRRYGGLRKYMPITFVTFGLAYLAIIGFPLLSGFFSKDKIIEATFAKGGTSGYLLGSITLVAAALTAFYMTRVMLMTFFGRERWKEPPVGAPADWHEPHPHESPSSMTLPMIVLAFGSVFAGGLFVLNSSFVNWLTPVTGFSEGDLPFSSWVVTAMALAMVAIGAFVAYVQYARREVPAVAPHGSLATVAARKDLYQDSINEGLVMRPGQYLTRWLVWLDLRGIDGFVGGLAAFIGGTSSRVRKIQTGFARSYALSMFGGTAVVIAAILMTRMA